MYVETVISIQFGLLWTMGRVGDSIRFVSTNRYFMYQSYDIDGSTKPHDVVIRSWTLTPDLLEWKADDDMALPLPCLWNSERFKNEGLARRVPVRPILSKQEDGVIYLLLGDSYLDEGLLLTKGEYILRVDIRTTTLLSSSRLPSNEHYLMPRFAYDHSRPWDDYYAELSDFFSAEFSAYHSEGKTVHHRGSQKLTD